jgi:hypothetical protein
VGEERVRDRMMGQIGINEHGQKKMKAREQRMIEIDLDHT